jgi:hypothetical protein
MADALGLLALEAGSLLACPASRRLAPSLDALEMRRHSSTRATFLLKSQEGISS